MDVSVIFQGNAMHKVMQIEGYKNFAVEYTSQYCMVSRLRNIRGNAIKKTLILNKTAIKSKVCIN